MLSLQRSGTHFLPYPQNHHSHSYSTTPLMENSYRHNEQQLHEDTTPWFARPIATNTGHTAGTTMNRNIMVSGGLRDREFVSSTNPPISITTGAAGGGKVKNLTIANKRSGSGSSNSTLSRSISPSSGAEENPTQHCHEDNYYSFYPSISEQQKIRSALPCPRFDKRVRDDELQLPEGKNAILPMTITKNNKLHSAIAKD